MPQVIHKKYISRQKNIRIYGIASTFILILLFLLFIFPIYRQEEKTEAAPVPSTTTIDITTYGQSSANLDLSVNSASGTFASSTPTDSAKFGIVTNNYTGYTLSILADDDYGLLTNANTGDTIGSIASAVDGNTFATGSASDYNNKWGYFPSKYNSIINTTNYYPAPTTTASVLDITNSANTTANEYTIGLGARVDYTKPTGTYTNTYTLIAVGNPVAYAIHYIDNSSGTETVLNTQSSTTAATSVDINSGLTPTRTGYTFSSWCDVATTVATNGSTSCSGNTYNEGDTLTFIDQTSDLSTANLYAIWTINTYKITYGTVTGITSMSLNGNNCTTTLSSGGCNATLTYGQNYSLTATVNTDNYNFKQWSAGSYGSIASSTAKTTTYTVGAGASTITPSVASCTALSGYMQSFAPTSASCTTGKLTDRRDNQIYTVGKINGNYWMTRNLAIGCAGSGNSYSGSYSQKTLTSTYSNVSAQYTTSTTSVTTSSTQNKTSCSATYGAWYDRAAATAGTQVATTTSSSYDICPSKWKLPSKTQVNSITNSQEYYELFKPVKGGSYAGSTLDNLFSLWWSSDPTSSGSTAVYALNWYYSYSYFTSTGPSYSRGNYVRCVLK